jgi:hypothetical protein
MLWRWGLPLGVCLFAVLGAILLHVVCFGSGPFIARCLLVPVAALFIYLAAVGVRLLPFCSVRVVADMESPP